MEGCEVTLWTSCEAVLEEKWTLRASHEVICALEAGTRSLADLLDDDDVEVIAVENEGVHSEGTRFVRRLEAAKPVEEGGVLGAPATLMESGRAPR